MEKYTFYPFIIFRTPLLSTDLFFENNTLRNNEFLEAIFLASSDFYNKLQIPNLTQKEELKLQHTLYKYQARASHRCTPFGLFAGIGCAYWDKKSEIILSKKYRRHSRLDMDILFTFFFHISSNVEVISNTKYFPNNSIYQLGNQLRYIEYQINNGLRGYSISSVNVNEHISKILKLAANGAVYSQLLASIISPKIPPATATLFLNELIKSQILVSELEPSVSGEEYNIRLVKQLNILNSKTHGEYFAFLLNSLKSINHKLSLIDAEQEKNNIIAYNDILTNLKNIGNDFYKKNFLQVDVQYTTIENKISTAIADKLLNTIYCLNKLFPLEPNKNLENFKERFLSRYEDRMMPILEVMDKDIGLGYPNGDNMGLNPLIDDLNFKDYKNESPFVWSKTKGFLLEKLIHSIRNEQSEITISSDEIHVLNSVTDKFADTISVMFEVLDTSNNKILFKYAGTPSATQLIGRFGFVSPEVKKMLNKISLDESSNNTGKIIAEIVHLPQNRVGNVLLRPVFREYEIPYLAQSGLNVENQIIPKDLKIGVRNNIIVLWSEKYNKEIIPKLGNAHNYSTSEIPLYRLLCDLQNQNNKNSIKFNWGVLERMFSYFPRVIIDDVIVSPSIWRFGKIELNEFHNKKKNALSNFLKQYNLPNEILLCEGDNELYFNFQLENSRSAFFYELKKKSNITLKEYLDKGDAALIKSHEMKAHSNECIAFLKKEVFPTNNLKNAPIQKVFGERKLIIGSEWIYFKIYTGIKMADKLLVDTFLPLMLEMESKNLINKWFFIRYYDPEFHIRLRICVKKKTEIGKVLKMMYNIIIKHIHSGTVYNYVLDSYNRELERYELGGIENTEKIFWLDSVAVLSFLSITNAKEKEVQRWEWGIINVNEILNDFNLNEEKKIEFLEIALKNFNKEFNGHKKENRIQLDYKFRVLRKQIDKLLSSESEFHKFNRKFFKPLNKRTSNSKVFVKQIIDKSTLDEHQFALYNYISSCIHMSLNRLFMGRQRFNEFVIYTLMFKYFSSRKAMIKIAKNK